MVREIPVSEEVATRWGSLYLDACATTPLAPEALEAMEQAWREAWANPSSLHGPGVAAATCLEKSRDRLAAALAATPDEVVWCSGGSEAIHLALLGSAETMEPGRLLISAVEHPATEAAAATLQRRGWELRRVPVDHRGALRLEALEPLLVPPTRLVSLIWGQSEVGTLQPVVRVGALCRERGIRMHVDAVQVAGHRPVEWASLPVDLLSLAAHKLQGPRGIGALLVRRGVSLRPLIGGAQEQGRRGGTESVPLAAGFAAALDQCAQRLTAHGGWDPVGTLRDGLWLQLRHLPGVELLGPDPADREARLPHHLSLLVRSRQGRPLLGRALVRALAKRGVACGSGSACSAKRGDPRAERESSAAASPVLLAMGFSPAEAAGGVRLSFGPWLAEDDLAPVPGLLAEAIEEVEQAQIVRS